MINGLLGRCRSLDEIGNSTILDVDVGGIPRNPDGLIRPGFPDGIEMEISESFQEDLAERCPSEDVTLHIEAHWDADPDATLLCLLRRQSQQHHNHRPPRKSLSQRQNKCLKMYEKKVEVDYGDAGAPACYGRDECCDVKEVDDGFVIFVLK